MENTLENKQKYFAAHWGQEVAIVPQPHSAGIDYNLMFVNDYYITNIAHLELTPLSQITDEDRISVGKLLHRLLSDEEAKLVGHSLTQYWGNIFEHPDYSLRDGVLIGDYLRSKGYAILYNGLSLEELIEYGWLRLK